MLCLLAKTMCGRTQLTMPRPDPRPVENHKFYRFYRNMQLDPLPREKLDPLEMFDRPSPCNIGKLLFNDSFFEKTMITGLPLQNKLRTYKKKKKKKKKKTRKKTTSEFFFSQSGLDPPPLHHRQTRRKFPWSAHRTLSNTKTHMRDATECINSIGYALFAVIEVSKGAKIRNRYNQVKRYSAT